MAIKDIVKVTRKTYFNPRGWLGYDTLKTQTSFIWQYFKQVFGPAFNPPVVEHAENFKTAMARLRLSEEDIREAGSLYFLLAIIFAFAAVCVLALFVKYLLNMHIAACLVSLGVSAFLLAQAFKYHFWHFQIKHRKLGCTFEEWYTGKPHQGGDHHV